MLRRPAFSRRRRPDEGSRPDDLHDYARIPAPRSGQAAGNVTAAANGILGVPVWVWPLVGVIAGRAVLFLLWQDRRKKNAA